MDLFYHVHLSILIFQLDYFWGEWNTHNRAILNNALYDETPK